jgi:hypothetical protein
MKFNELTKAQKVYLKQNLLLEREDSVSMTDYQRADELVLDEEVEAKWDGVEIDESIFADRPPRRLVSINGKDVSSARGYVYDGCHRFYVIFDEDDADEAMKDGREILPLDETMFAKFKSSCPLRFIYDWKLDNYILPQSFDCDYAEAEFKYDDGSVDVYEIPCE